MRFINRDMFILILSIQNMQMRRRRKDFLRLDHQKAITGPTWGPEGEGTPPPDGTEFHFVNDAKSSKILPFVKNVNILLARIIHFFYRKIENILQEFLNVFEILFKIFNL